MKTKSKHCLYCNNIVKDNYCSKCGQPTNTSRINIMHIIAEVQFGILHINKGILYTIKELIIHPGSTVKNYIWGKRVKYTKPLLYLILAGVLYSLIFHYFEYFPMENMNRHESVIFEYIPIYKWYSEHYSITLLFLVPFYALTSFWLFRKKEYNYTEHLVLFSFLTGTKIFILLLFFPLVYLTKSPDIYKISEIVAEAYLICGLVVFFKSTSYIKTTLKVILSLVLALMIMLVLIFILFKILQYYDIKL